MSESALPPRFQSHVDPAERLGVVYFFGKVTGQDMMDGAAALFAMPGWEDDFDVIWDCSQVEKHVLAPEEMKPLVDEVTQHEGGHDALVESEIAQEDVLGDLLVRFIRRRGKSASAHSNQDGALRTLGRDALPQSLLG